VAFANWLMILEVTVHMISVPNTFDNVGSQKPGGPTFHLTHTLIDDVVRSI